MKKNIRSITINDVAAAAKVSTATVSRLFNQPDTVSNTLKQRIQEVIKRLGYIPNAGARSLMLRRSGTIGVVIPTLDNAIFSQGLAEFQKQLNQSGHQLLVASSNYDPESESNQINNLLLRGVEGLALFGTSQKREALKLLKNRGVPYIHIGSLSVPLNGYASGFDNREVIKLGIHHLLEKGHKQFGILSGITANNDRAKDRLNGAIDLLYEHRIHLKEGCIIECAYELHEARLGLKKLLLKNPKISAVICGNDVLALGALFEAQNQGLKVPDDLSIIGFDDLEISKHVLPRLTTIRIDAIGMWAQAANHLVSQINGVSNLPRKVITNCNLVIRESTGVAPKKRHPLNPKN